MNRPLMVAACVALAVAGCGGDDDTSSDESDATSAGTTLAVPVATSVAAPDTTVAISPTSTAARSTTSTTATATPTTATSTSVASCSRPTAAGRTDRTVEIAGLSRHYILYVPAGYDGSPTRLVLALHGSGSDAAEQLDTSNITAVADAHGFIVAAPDAGVVKTVGDTGPTGGVWNIPGTVYVDGTSIDPNAPDDVAFIDELITQLRAELCVDGVAATGASGGGRMASALACLSDQIGAVGPVAGLRLPEGCAPAHPVDIVAFHGTDDLVNPYLGGGPASWGPQSVPDAAAAWALLQQCSAGPTRAQVSPSVVLDTWSGCAGGVEVRLYTVAGGGHTWPGGVDIATTKPELAAIVGVTTQEINAGELMWERFAVMSTADPLSS